MALPRLPAAQALHRTTIIRRLFGLVISLHILSLYACASPIDNRLDIVAAQSAALDSSHLRQSTINTRAARRAGPSVHTGRKGAEPLRRRASHDGSNGRGRLRRRASYLSAPGIHNGSEAIERVVGCRDSSHAGGASKRPRVGLPLKNLAVTMNNASSALGPRWGHASVFVPATNQILFIGGQVDNQGRTTNDVLAMNLNSTSPDSTPTPINSTGLPPLAWTAAAVDSASRVWVVGGATADCHSDAPAYVFDPQQPGLGWVAPTLTPGTGEASLPPRRRQAAAVSAAKGTAFYVTGGIADSTTCYGGDASRVNYVGLDTYTPGAGTASNGSPETSSGQAGASVVTAPLQAANALPPSSDYTAVLLPDGKSIAYFGGLHSDGSAASFSDIVVLDTGTGAWKPMSTAGNAPTSRVGHSAVLTPDGKILVHGGQSVAGGGDANNQSPALTDTFALDVSTEPWTWSTPSLAEASTNAPGVAWHSAVMIGNVMVTAFGQNGAQSTDGTTASAAGNSAPQISYLDTAAQGGFSWSNQAPASLYSAASPVSGPPPIQNQGPGATPSQDSANMGLNVDNAASVGPSASVGSSPSVGPSPSADPSSTVGPASSVDPATSLAASASPTTSLASTASSDSTTASSPSATASLASTTASLASATAPSDSATSLTNSASSTDSSASDSPTTSVMAKSTPSNTKSSGSSGSSTSGGAVAGGIVGATLALGALAGLYHIHRKRRRAASLDETGEPPVSSMWLYGGSRTDHDDQHGLFRGHNRSGSGDTSSQGGNEDSAEGSGNGRSMAERGRMILSNIAAAQDRYTSPVFAKAEAMKARRKSILRGFGAGRGDGGANGKALPRAFISSLVDEEVTGGNPFDDRQEVTSPENNRVESLRVQDRRGQRSPMSDGSVTSYPYLVPRNRGSGILDSGSSHVFSTDNEGENGERSRHSTLSDKTHCTNPFEDDRAVSFDHQHLVRTGRDWELTPSTCAAPAFGAPRASGHLDQLTKRIVDSCSSSPAPPFASAASRLAPPTAASSSRDRLTLGTAPLPSLEGFQPSSAATPRAVQTGRPACRRSKKSTLKVVN